MGNEQTRGPSKRDGRNSGLPGDQAPRAREGAAKARKLLAGLGKFLSPREPDRAGVYLPLVRIDGND